MYLFLSILILIAAILLIGVVLIQKSKGGGLASGFSGGNQILGVKSTTTFIEKATWSLAGFIAVLSIISAIIAPKEQGDQIQSQVAPKTEQAAPNFGTNAAPAATPAPAPTTPAQ